jgi:hypothetical protein
MCWGWFLLSAAWLYVHINFPTPCVLPISLDVVAVVVTFYVHPHVHSVFSLLMRTALVLVSLKNFPLDIPQMCMGFTLTEHVENIINFISLRFSSHIVSHFKPTLFSPFLPSSRTKTSPFDLPKMNWEKFSIFWHFWKWNFVKLFLLDKFAGERIFSKTKYQHIHTHT